jgi:predicted metal-dependent hydrolase
MDVTDKVVRIVRSAKRLRTVSILEKDDCFEIRAPATSTDEELQPIISKLVRRLERRRVKKTLSDDDLHRRAAALNLRVFDGKLRWTSIAWATNQDQRWGSCTPGQGTIRLSSRLAEYPPWVLDYVILHELAHLVEANHGRRFWRLVQRFPLAERARGYLIAIAGDQGEEEM